MPIPVTMLLVQTPLDRHHETDNTINETNKLLKYTAYILSHVTHMPGLF